MSSLLLMSDRIIKLLIYVVAVGQLIIIVYNLTTEDWNDLQIHMEWKWMEAQHSLITERYRKQVRERETERETETRTIDYLLTLCRILGHILFVSLVWQLDLPSVNERSTDHHHLAIHNQQLYKYIYIYIYIIVDHIYTSSDWGNDAGSGLQPLQQQLNSSSVPHTYNHTYIHIYNPLVTYTIPCMNINVIDN